MVFIPKISLNFADGFTKKIKELKYAEVILPLALPKLYTYGIPPDMEDSCTPGVRAVVQFGRKKIYTGIIKRVSDNKPEYETKNISSILDERPVVSEKQLRLWDWVSEYYLSTTGEIFKAALPSGLKLESETYLEVIRTENNEEELKEKEVEIIGKISADEKMTLRKLQNQSDYNVYPTIKRLIERGIISSFQYLKEKYKPKYETYIRLPDTFEDEKYLSETLKKLKRAKKQSQLLMDLIYISIYGSELHGGLKASKVLRKQDVLKHSDASASVLKSLVDKNILIEEQTEVGRLSSGAKKDINKPLSPAQQNAEREISKAFTKKDTVLLHGVTSSGKTEVYIQMIKEQVKQNRQVLYLLPEIALTHQIISRLTDIFGEKVGVYHSKFNDAERVELWKNMLDGDKLQVILGVRSSVFLPFSDLGLIIVDEEHENTYKQFNPAPRYNARDLSAVLTKMHGAKLLLGTATPSAESFYNVEIGKYAYVKLNERFGNIQMPEILIADLKDARRRKKMKSLFAPLLYEHILNALKRKEQVILFQNRRGYSPFKECEKCGNIPKCLHCDVSLTYHKREKRLICHYCGYSQNDTARCDACGSIGMTERGYGTEKIESEAAALFPNARIARLDTDTTRSKKAYTQIIGDFESGGIDILVGTQMISKGLDFDGVSIVGIMNADAMLNFPDFRAYERSYQLMTQVAGRAGRRKKRGKVIIQTSDKKNPILEFVKNNDFDGMIRQQFTERKNFKYPPFYRLIKIYVRHKKVELLENAADALANDLRLIFGKRVLGPEFPLVSRIKNRYIKQIYLKFERNKSSRKVKELVLKTADKIKMQAKFKTVEIIPDIDPM